MAKLIFRDNLPFREWQALASDGYELLDMERRLLSRDEDCGFVGEIMAAMYGREVQVWESYFYSFKNGVLIFEATWDYPHSTGLNTVTKVRVMEGEL